MRRYLGLAVILLPIGACDGRSVPSGDGGADLHAQQDAKIHVTPDSRVMDQRVLEDQAPRPDANTCYCKAGEVWLFSACVPTTQLGCGPTCDPQQPASCPAGYQCDPSAALPFCIASSTRPACVPKPAPSMEPGTLRVTPTLGTAGKPVTLTIEGAEFWIGALEWMARLGNGKPEMFSLAPTTVCSRQVTLTPPNPGIYPVEVGYGVPPSGNEWKLAGFFVASGGVKPPPLVQPGYPCTPADQCAETAPYKCTCAAGRCACN